MPLGAPLGEVGDVVVLRRQAGLAQSLDPEAPCGGHADGAAGELADELVAAALGGAGAQPLLHQGAHELEGLGDLRVGGVGALPQEAAGVGALVVGVEAVPQPLPAGGLGLGQEAGVVDVEPRHDPAPQAVGPVERHEARARRLAHLTRHRQEVLVGPVRGRVGDAGPPHRLGVEVHVRGVEVDGHLVEGALVHEGLDEAGVDVVEVVLHLGGVALDELVQRLGQALGEELGPLRGDDAHVGRGAGRHHGEDLGEEVGPVRPLDGLEADGDVGVAGGERVDEGLPRRGVLVRPQDRDRQRVVVPAGDVRAREARPLAAEEGEGAYPHRPGQ